MTNFKTGRQPNATKGPRTEADKLRDEAKNRDSKAGVFDGWSIVFATIGAAGALALALNLTHDKEDPFLTTTSLGTAGLLPAVICLVKSRYHRRMAGQFYLQAETARSLEASAVTYQAIVNHYLDEKLPARVDDRVAYLVESGVIQHLLTELRPEDEADPPPLTGPIGVVRPLTDAPSLQQGGEADPPETP